MQQLAMPDYTSGSYYLDVTTAFSLRPPELVIFDKLELYAKWFCFKSRGKRRYSVDIDLSLCLWVDGAGRQVRLRHAHVSSACEYLFHLQTSADIVKAEHATELCTAIFNDLHYEHGTVQQLDAYSDLYNTFVDITKRKRNVVVFTQVTPSQFSRFLVHLLLSTGSYVTEIDLYSSPSMLEAFCRATLIPNDEPTEEDVKRIARQYVIDQLQWLSVGTRRFSKLFQCLVDGLERFLLHGELMYDSIPLYLERDMVASANLDVADLEHSRHSSAVDALFHELNHIVPDSLMQRN
jgi:hypothetical protein